MKLFITAACISLLPLTALAIDGKPGSKLSAGATVDVVAETMVSHTLLPTTGIASAENIVYLATGTVNYSEPKKRTVYKWAAGEPTDNPGAILLSGINNPDNKMRVSIFPSGGFTWEKPPEGYATSLRTPKNKTEHLYYLASDKGQEMPIDNYNVSVIAYDWVM